MRRSASTAPRCRTKLSALLLIGSIRLLAIITVPQNDNGKLVLD
jgi:hypothetical protein